MKYLQRSMAFLVIFAVTSFAHATLVTNLEDATNGGGFFGTVTFTNNGANTVNISANIADPINAGLTKGDILGLWFDFSDFSSLSGMPTFSGTTAVLESSYGENSVGMKPFNGSSSNINLNGTSENDWDLAVQVGFGGNTGGFNQTIDFNLMIAGLNESMFAEQRVGMRVQSINGLTGFTQSSSKLIGTGEPSVSVPAPGALSLLGIGLLGLGFIRRKRSA